MFVFENHDVDLHFLSEGEQDSKCEKDRVFVNVTYVDVCVCVCVHVCF